MKVPKSKTAMKLMEYAHPFCEIWFVCDQNMIFTRNPVEDLRSVSVFVDADDDMWMNVENSLDHVAQNVEETYEQRVPATFIEEEPHDAMVPSQANAVREVELLHRQKQEVTVGTMEVAELQEQSKQLVIERDNALRNVKFLEEQKKQMMTEWKFFTKEIVELRKNIMMAEQENLRRKIEVLRKEKHETTTKLDHAVLEAMEARRDKKSMMAKRDSALLETKGLRAQLEQVMSERDEAVSRDISELPCSRFTREELRNATLRFSDGLQVGQGGFGVVYKGFLWNTTVAGLSTLYFAALALVYEFMPNGSLEDCLEHASGAPSLSWQARTRIITELCSALSFLHNNKTYAVVHGDVKPANILLDGNLVAKLSDFGGSRCLLRSDQGPQDSGMLCTSHPWGTLGYMDPEFQITGVLTPRSDTYSFGARSPLNIARVVRDAMERGDLRSVVDTSAGDWPIAQARWLAHLALRCTEMTSDKRPDLAGEVWSVVKRLADEANGEALVGSSRQHFGIGQQQPGVSAQVLVCDDNDSCGRSIQEVRRIFHANE
ncbi:hypothetical protein HU200_056160 [Digitaria exilis]|uniref:RING-type E3 ubiquitin transferase n=1 Tax=Digitaria exilis TaxID=1010633 RepID=A0A835E162_9POAL|nr:hypothetical protein HU200_056160 [Digitaria exilis]